MALQPCQKISGSPNVEGPDFGWHKTRITSSNCYCARWRGDRRTVAYCLVKVLSRPLGLPRPTAGGGLDPLRLDRSFKSALEPVAVATPWWYASTRAFVIICPYALLASQLVLPALPL